MPELPEVETVKNTLQHLIINKEIADIDIYYDKIIKNVSPEEFILLLKKQKFQEFHRKGKYLIFVLTDVILVSHLRMEGKYFLMHDEELNKHEHIVFKFTDGSNLRYHDTRKFGTMYLYKTTNIAEVLKLKPLNKVGHDAINNDISIDELFKRFQKTTKPIKVTLLDQTIISGIGNIYVDEICFMSRIHPLTPTKNLSIEQVAEVLENTRIVLNKAIALGGTTIKSFTSSHAVTGRFQNELLVHTKTICPECQNKILKIRVGGRGTYYCGNCQIMIDN